MKFLRFHKFIFFYAQIEKSFSIYKMEAYFNTTKRSRRIPKRTEKIVIQRNTVNNRGKEANCYVCNKRIWIKQRDTWHDSHVIARANRGTDDSYNLRIACKDCNWKCGTQNMDVFKALCRIEKSCDNIRKVDKGIQKLQRQSFLFH